MAYEKKTDIDSIETREWLDALQNVLKNDGSERASFLLQELLNPGKKNSVVLFLKFMPISIRGTATGLHL